MKKLVLIIAVSAASVFHIHAQSGQGGGGNSGYSKQSPEDRANKDAEWAEQQLGLSADQKVKWHDASLQKINANEPIREKMKATSDQSEKQTLGAQMRENSQKFDVTVSAFLTADQKTKWDQVKEERKEGHRGGGQGHSGGGSH